MIHIEILTSDELHSRLVDYNLKDPYKKLDVLCEEIKYFSLQYEFRTTNVFVCAFEEGELVGSAKLKIGGCDSSMNPGWNNWISFISVRTGYFGKGIGKLLVENLFKYASENKLSILTSGYSMRGWFHLRKHIHNFAFKYGVILNDPKIKPDFYDFETFEEFEENKYKKLIDKFAKKV